jgi:predicted Zn-dependent peptidase
VWITCGSAHEPSQLSGATHLIEHLELRRCGSRDRKSLARLVDRLGGEVDAWTSHELMGVTVQTTLDALDEGIGLLLDAVLAPTFDPADVELERRVVLAELEMLNDDPVERVEEALLHAAWGDHPLARPVIGNAKNLASFDPETLRRHHETLVRPGRLLAAVVGDVNPLEIADKLDRLSLDRHPEPPRLPSLTWRGDRRTLNREGIDQVHARIAFPAVAAGDPTAVDLTVLNRSLGVGASSQLFQRLREEEGLTYDIWSAPFLRRLGGILEIGWTCAPEVFDDVRRLVSEELAEFVADVDADQVEVAKEGLLRALTVDCEIPAARCAMDVAEVLDRGRRFDPEQAIHEMEAVSVDRVRRLAQDLLRPDRMAAAVCGPEGLEVRFA